MPAGEMVQFLIQSLPILIGAMVDLPVRFIIQESVMPALKVEVESVLMQPTINN
jgi:hypothetical protein